MRARLSSPTIALLFLLAGTALSDARAARSTTDRAQLPLTAGDAVLEIHDPAILDALETKGLALGDLLAARKGGRGTHDLGAADPASPYSKLVRLVTDDLADLRASMRRNGIAETRDPRDNDSRVFDVKWLVSSDARFELIGVVNRYDRKDFSAFGCGETRFIYRLAYTTTGPRATSSRFPFFLNAVFDNAMGADGKCPSVARRWVPSVETKAAADAAVWLLSGPLDPANLKPRQLEINAQLVRNVSGGAIQAGGEKTFGGQAAYLLRILSLARDEHSRPTLAPKKLENTIDADRLSGNAILKSEVVRWVRDHLSEIDLGTYALPEEWSSERAFSYSTFGGARLANRPFARTFKTGELGTNDFSKARFLNSNAALLERLDNNTCMGCHQASSTAGFHFLGFDRVSTNPLNEIKIAVSPHFYADAFRRTAYLAEVIAGREPDRFRPLSSAPRADWTSGGEPIYREAGITMPCVPAESASAFKVNWKCGSLADDGKSPARIACAVYAKSAGIPVELGQCLMTEEPKVFSGHPCIKGDVVNSPADSADGDVPMFLKDRFINDRRFHSPGAQATPDSFTCRPPSIGVPGGISYRQCGERDKAFTRFTSTMAAIPNEICGAVGGTKFDTCVASGDFNSCIRESTLRGMRSTCGKDRFCREDYICQQFPNYIPGAGGSVVRDYGFCSPTYFLFQMRIDGHPKR